MQPPPNAANAMPGKRYLLDTNAVVALLQGHAGLLALVNEADWIGVSVISELEFLGFEGLSEPDHALFLELLSRVTVVDLCHSNTELIKRVTALRKSRNVKLPDAIIMATAAQQQATTITRDAVLLKLNAAEFGCATLAF
jgi:tRNA(fMet)-specific endonuclease VapC